ncbi:hypothetical protein [Moraxella boevrei]|uniref:hypothetical protein n=1 Tax=Faucicola boevrei TaxID=346665 RepID=UPI00373653FB
MLYLTDIKSVFTDQNDSEQQRILLIVNAYLTARIKRTFDDVPEAIKQAGIELAQGFIKGEILQGRTESVVTSKSVKAGDVSSSKTFSSHEKDKAMGQHEMIALLLIEPFIAKFLGLANLPVIRG